MCEEPAPNAQRSCSKDWRICRDVAKGRNARSSRQHMTSSGSDFCPRLLDAARTRRITKSPLGKRLRAKGEPSGRREFRYVSK
jgi:hypothetical protein